MYTTREVSEALKTLVEDTTGRPVIQGFPLWSARRIEPPLSAVLLSGVEPEAQYLVMGRGVTYYVYSVVCYGEDEQQMGELCDVMISLFASSNVEVLPDALAYMIQATRAENPSNEVKAQNGMEFILQILQGA